MIETIGSLGHQVEALWKKEGFAKEIFPEIASKVLKEGELHRQFTLEGFFSALWKRNSLPPQLSMDNTFGYPPITLYDNADKHFLIDIYFWVLPDISIHSHGFRGAFTLLQGKSLHCHYDFQILENLQDTVFIGDLRFKEAISLKEGDVQKILPGPAFIHQVWHLSFPTVSIAIRTVEEGQRQYTYLSPHVAFQEHLDLSSLAQKQIDALTMLSLTKHPRKAHFLERLVSEVEPHEGLLRLRAYFVATGDLKEVEKILEGIPKFRKWTPSLLKSFRHAAQMKTVHWPSLQDEEERLLIALLCSFPGKEGIERFLRTHDPEKPADTFILEGLKRLMKRKKIGFRLNETALHVFELLLRGLQEEEICKKLSEVYEVQDLHRFRQEILRCCSQLRSMELLKGLLPSSRQMVSV